MHLLINTVFSSGFIQLYKSAQKTTLRKGIGFSCKYINKQNWSKTFSIFYNYIMQCHWLINEDHGI